MGFWGVSVLENDDVLDWMEINATSLWKLDVIEYLFDSQDEAFMTLGVAAVVTALRGFKQDVWSAYEKEYKQYLISIPEQVDYKPSDLVDRAKKILQYLKDSYAGGWLNPGERIEYLDKLGAYLKKDISVDDSERDYTCWDINGNTEVVKSKSHEMAVRQLIDTFEYMVVECEQNEATIGVKGQRVTKYYKLKKK